MEVLAKKGNKKSYKNKMLRKTKTSEMDKDSNNEDMKEILLESEQTVHIVEDQTKCADEDFHQKLNIGDEELVNKIEVIREMEHIIIGLKQEIEILSEQVKERDLRLRSLEEKNEYLKDNFSGDKGIPLQLVDQDVSKKDVTKEYLVLAVKEKDQKIEKLKMKINNLQDQLNKISSNQCPEGKESTMTDFLTIINKRTKNRFNSTEECLSYFETISQLKRNSSKDYPGSNYGSDKSNKFNEELEDLNDEIYGLECKIKAQEKKSKNDLRLKDYEIDELNEEIESMRKNKGKEKVQIKILEQRIEDLDSELELRTDEISFKDKKIKDLLQKDKEAQTECDRLVKKVEQQQQENNRLNEQLSSVKKILEEAKESQNVNEELTITVKKKQNALDVMKHKIEALNTKIVELTTEKTVLQKDLKSVKEAERLKTEEFQAKNVQYREQVNKIIAQEIKIKQLENEMEKEPVKQFRYRPNPQMGSLDKNTGIESSKVLQLACPNCRLLCEYNEIQAHVKTCLELS